MLFSLSSLRRGPALLGLGMGLVICGQFYRDFPIVTAMAIVAWGAILTLYERPRTSRQDILSILNLVIYSSLVCLAIVAQSQHVLRHASGQVHPIMLLDHAAAIVVLLGLCVQVTRRLSQPLVEES